MLTNVDSSTPTGTVEDQTIFLRAVMSWMDAQPWIFRYAWFMCVTELRDMSGGLVNADGSPTEFGKTYAYST